MAKDFNQDMDRYLQGRDDADSKFSLFRKKKKDSVTVRSPELETYGEDDAQNSGFLSRLFRKKQPEPVQEDLSPEELAKLRSMEQEIEAIDEAEESATGAEYVELESRRSSLMERFFQSLRLFRHEHKLEEEVQDIAHEESALQETIEAEREARALLESDIKEIMKISHKWLGKMNKRVRDDFKDSKDFARYKELLKKHGLVREK